MRINLILIWLSDTQTWNQICEADSGLAEERGERAAALRLRLENETLVLSSGCGMARNRS